MTVFLKNNYLRLLIFYYLCVLNCFCEQFLHPVSNVSNSALVDRWKKHYTTRGNYRQSEVQTLLLTHLNKLDQQGKIGNRILELGSNFYPLSWKLSKNIKERSIVCVDIIFDQPELHNKKIKTLMLGGNIEDLSNVILKYEKYIEKIHYEDNELLPVMHPKFDTIIINDVLNYVDYQKVLKQSFKLLRRGGNMFISNMAGVGFKEKMPLSGVKHNKKLLFFLKQLKNVSVTVIRSPIEQRAGFLSSKPFSYPIKQFFLELGGMIAEDMTWQQRASLFCKNRQILYLSS